MKKEELLKILAEEMKEVRKKTYAELKTFVLQKKTDAYEIEQDKKKFEIEVQYFWDGDIDGDIRIICSISQPYTFSTFVPLSEDLIMARDGSFKE